MSSNLIGHIANTMGYLIPNNETINNIEFKNKIIELYKVSDLTPKYIIEFLDNLDDYTFCRIMDDVIVYKNGIKFIT